MKGDLRGRNSKRRQWDVKKMVTLLGVTVVAGCGGGGSDAEKAAEANSNLDYTCRQVFDDQFVTNYDCEAQPDDYPIAQLCRVTYDKATSRWGASGCP